MLVGFAYSLGWLNNHVSRVLIAHLLYHAERSQVLKVAASFAIAEIGVKLIWHEALSVGFVTRNAAKDKVYFQLLFSRHFRISCRDNICQLFVCLLFWAVR
jgi:hypothetical protein